MTLGPKFFCSSKMAVTRRRSKLWWRKAHQSKALDVSYLSSLSKRDLKHSGNFFSKICMRPWIRSLWNIWPKRPLRDDFLTFEISKNMFPGIFFGFDICNPKLFALTSRSSIVPSLQNINLIQFLMILMSKNIEIKKIETYFWPVLKYVKKIR